jgi:hypothetical protein
MHSSLRDQYREHTAENKLVMVAAHTQFNLNSGALNAYLTTAAVMQKARCYPRAPRRWLKFDIATFTTPLEPNTGRRSRTLPLVMTRPHKTNFMWRVRN